MAPSPAGSHGFSRSARTALVVAAAWCPTLVLWVGLLGRYFHLPLSPSLAVGAIATATTGLLSWPVWRLCRHFPWPGRISVRFYAGHAALAAAYATLWVISLTLFSPYRRLDLLAALQRSDLPPLQFLFGVWLYAGTAAVCYALQTRRRLSLQEQLAERAERLAIEARLSALRARLNPHFLFNALHSLAALAREEPARSEGAILELGDMLRYSLAEFPGDLVPLREEWAFTRRYLEFERLRFEDRLRVETELDEAALDARVPPFALQTLVENAVRHAVSVRASGGYVRITVRGRTDSVALEVSDDGPAEPVPLAPRAVPPFGIGALRQRLQATFGDEARLTLDQARDGCRCRLTVPWPVPAPAGLGSPMLEVLTP